MGWHLHLADSRPCTAAHWPWGRSPAAAGLAIGLSASGRHVARREIDAQWAAFRETGLPCRFVSTHHHLHFHPVVARMLRETLRDDFAGWVRAGRPRFFAPHPLRPVYAALDLLLQARFRRTLPFAHTDDQVHHARIHRLGKVCVG